MSVKKRRLNQIFKKLISKGMWKKMCKKRGWKDKPLKNVVDRYKCHSESKTFTAVLRLPETHANVSKKKNK